MAATRGWISVLCVVVLAACGGDDGAGTVSGSGGSGGSGGSAGNDVIVCTRDIECSDGLYCTGAERCDPADDDAGDDGCVAGTVVTCDDDIACTIDRCLEERQQCENLAPDHDDDGHVDMTCVDGAGDPFGDDCDDQDNSRFPGNTEVCDQDDHDEDCDATTYGVVDQDGDLAHDASCCNVDDDGTAFCGTDCKDLVREVNPDASEVCDALDNDCDAAIDEGSAMPGFVDADYDGYGDSAMAITACAGTLRFALVGNDCDDADSDRNPGQVEVCDTKDNDCNGSVDDNPRQVPWYADSDGDNFGDPFGDTVISCAPVTDHVLSDSDCDDQSSAIHPAAAEACDGIDNNCNGRLDYAIDVNDSEDDDGDGLYDAACLGGTDCDDDNATTGLGGDELCDGRDNDCDEAVDEGTHDSAWFRDDDHDGWGDDSGGFQVSCAPIEGRVTRDGDCDDQDVLRHPAASELCNRRDDNCDGAIDGADADPSCARANAFSSCGDTGCVIDSCTPGYADCDRVLQNGCEELIAGDRCEGTAGVGHAGSGGSGGSPPVDGGIGGVGGNAGTGGSGTISDGCGSEIDCGKGCVDILNDVDNCGGCGIRCNSGVCMDGLCDCTPSQDLCDGVCISTRADSNNCGGCGVICPSGNSCTLDNCMPSGGARTVSGAITSPQGGWLNGIEITVEPPLAAAAITASDGTFSMQLPDGTYRFRARHPTSAMRFFPAHIERTVNGNDVSDIDFNAERGATLSGSLSYSGSRSGRVYVIAQPANGGFGGVQLGTSVANVASTWSIEGVPPGDYQVIATMDHLGIGRQHAQNPGGGLSTMTVNGNPIDNLTIMLGDPPLVAPSPPVIHGAAPSTGSVLLLWDSPRDNKGAPTAERFNIYFRRNAAPTTSVYDGVISDVPLLESDGNYMHTGLTDGDVYYYLMTSVAGGLEGAASNVMGPVTIGAPQGGVSVSGIANSSNFAPAGPLTVVLFSEQGGLHFTSIANPIARQPFTILGVPPGVYKLLAFVDDDHDHSAGPRDPGAGDDQGAPQVFVTTMPIDDAHVGLTVRDARTAVVTMVHRDQGTLNVDYSVGLTVSSERKQVVGVRLIDGAGAMTPSDLVFTSDHDNGVGIPLGVLPARSGDLYTIDIRYDDGMVQRVVQPVRNVMGVDQLALPTAPTPNATIACVQPTMFSWQAPPVPPAAFNYRIDVRNAGLGNDERVFEANDLPSSQTSVAFTGSAPPPMCGGSQHWSVLVVDDEGNRAESSASYTFSGL